MTPDPIERLKTDLAAGRVVAVVGTGVSIGATPNPCASWTGLLETGIEHCLATNYKPSPEWVRRIREEIASGDTDELLSAAGKIVKRLGPGGDFGRWLAETVGLLRVSNSAVIEAISQLGIRLTTTNYDDLLEEVTGLDYITWLDYDRVDNFIQNREEVVLHLHGHWRQPASIIMDDTSYERLRSDRHARNALNSLGTVATLLFIGCGNGLSDPNFDRYLQWMREIFATSPNHHYRLCCDKEEASALIQHPPNDRIRLIKYGSDYSELAPFLRGLKGEQPKSQAVIAAVQPPEPIRLPPVPPCFGRGKEVHKLVTVVCSKLPASVPVLGTAGVGKTTVTVAALHAAKVKQRFGDRRYFIRCEATSGGEGLLGEIARKLQIKPGLELETRVFNELECAPTLLILDNLETPWWRDPHSTEDLLKQLATLPQLALIASLRGEQRPRGPHWKKPIKLNPLKPAAARKAFLDLTGGDFQSDPLLDPFLKAVDYLPLAINLLASQAEGSPDLALLWQRWQHEKTRLLQRVGGGKRDVDLEASLELSISSPRMTADSQRLMALLGYLTEGIAQEDIDCLLPQVGEAAASTLRQLGLTVRDDPRLRMYAPIREYVRTNHSPSDADRSRAVHHFLRLLRQETASSANERFTRLAAEVGNLEIAILEALARPTPSDGIEAALDLTKYPFAAESFQNVLPVALDKARETKNPLHIARVLTKLGDASMGRSQHEHARPRFTEALSLFKQVEDLQGEAYSLRKLGEIAFRLSDHNTAKALWEEAMPIFRSVDDVAGEAFCELGLGDIALDRSDREAAVALFRSALEKFRAAGSDLGAANCTRNLGIIARDRSDYLGARSYFEDALRRYRKIGEVIGEANCITDLGDLALTELDYPAACRRFEEAIPLYRRLDSQRGVANCVRKLGEVALQRGDFDKARTHLEKALDLYGKVKASFGRAHCFRGLGDIAAAQSRPADALYMYKKSLSLFESIPNPEFIAKLKEQIERVSPHVNGHWPNRLSGDIGET